MPPSVPVRSSVGLLLVVLLAGLMPLASAHGTGVHSPNVEDAHHVPALPVAGQPVSIHLYVVNDTRIESVRAIYCRVERYACAPAIVMTETSPKIYDGLIPWNTGFFEGVTQVGYKFEIRYYDGTNESTPIQHSPARPAALPEGADTYYYYTLEATPKSPSIGTVSLILLLVLAPLAWRTRP